MRRNFVGITIHAQKQLEFDRVEQQCPQPSCPPETVQPNEQFVLDKPHSDV